MISRNIYIIHCRFQSKVFERNFKTHISSCKPAVICDPRIFLFILHMITNRMRIFIIKTKDQACKIVILIQSCSQLSADEWKLIVKIIRMACLEVLHKSWNRQSIYIIKAFISVYRKINNSQKCVSIYILIITNLSYGLVAKT